MLKIGLTGGIGSGKSTASKYLAELNAYIYDADIEAKYILFNNDKVQSDLKEEFGSDILNSDGEIDKNKLARVAFQDEDHQIVLNSIIHPHIFSDIDNRFEKTSKSKKYKIFIVDAALIFEAGIAQHFDTIILIASSVKYRIERALQRGNLTRDDILRRMDLQWTDEDKAGMANHTIYNNGTVKELEEKIKTLYKDLV